MTSSPLESSPSATTRAGSRLPPVVVDGVQEDDITLVALERVAGNERGA